LDNCFNYKNNERSKEKGLLVLKVSSIRHNFSPKYPVFIRLSNTFLSYQICIVFDIFK